jgi:plastocyanin
MRNRRRKCKSPPRMPVAAALCLALAAAVPAAEIRGNVTVGAAVEAQGRTADVGISVAALPLDGQALPARASADHRVIIRHNHFQPVYLAVRRGDRLTFVNEDPVYHRIHSRNGTRGFDVHLSKPGTAGASRTVTMTGSGTWHLFGRIFPRLYARIDVLDTPYIRNLAGPGRFGFTGLAAGRWQLRAAAVGTAVVHVETEAFTAPPPVHLTLPLRGLPPEGGRPHAGGKTPANSATASRGADSAALFPRARAAGP